MAGRSFDQADWIFGHALQTTAPHRDECKGAPPPDLSPSADPASAPASSAGGAAASDDGSSTVAVKSEGGGAGGGLRRDPAWPDGDWIRLMLCMPLPQAGDELSAIRAWDLLSGHPRRGELDRRDYGAIIDELKPKINCYGSVFPPFAPRFCPWRFGGGLMGEQVWRRGGGVRGQGCADEGARGQGSVAETGDSHDAAGDGAVRLGSFGAVGFRVVALRVVGHHINPSIHCLFKHTTKCRILSQSIQQGNHLHVMP
jgi:hypothetical protein